MSTPERYDAIVIGGGHNGLAAAATLGAKGKRTLVLERRPRLGGMAETAEIAPAAAPGLRGPRLAHLLIGLDAALVQELGLARAGLRFVAPDTATVALCPEGRHVVVEGGRARFASGAPHPDAEAFERLHVRLARFGALLAPLWRRTPPKLAGGGYGLAALSETADLAKLGLALRASGKAEMRELLRILLSNIRDVVLDHLPDGPLAAVLAHDATLGSRASPYAPGTVVTLLTRLGRGTARLAPIGGMGAYTDALAAAAKARGASLRTDAEVARVLVEGDRAVGVALADGREARAPLVLSGLSAEATMRLAAPEHFDVEPFARARKVRAEGVTAKLNLALAEAPIFRGLDAALAGARLLIAPSIAAIERAFTPVKYGEMADRPILEVIVPTARDRTLAPQGGHMLSAIVQFAPFALEGGWSEAARERLTRAALSTLEVYAPGLSASVRAVETLTPADIARETGAPGGHWSHGEPALDQLLTLRPANGLSRYASGLPGLHFCGASAHPGGDVSGLCGRNAARQALLEGAPKPEAVA